MALSDINDLPDNPAAGQSGHRQSHAKIHSGLKSVKEELDGFANVQRRQLVPVSTKAWPPADASIAKSNGTLVGGTAKLGHVATRTFYGAQLLFVNWVSGTSNTEMDGWNDITVGAAIEPVGNGVWPITFGGKSRVTISPGGFALSDPIGVDIAKGSTFWTRTFVQVSSGQFFPLGNISTASTGEGNNYGSTVGADLTLYGSASLTGVGTNQYVYGPAMILGQVVDPGKPVIGILGDSIFNGIGDNSHANGGYAQRALANNYSFAKLAFPGEGLSSGWTGLSGANRRRRVGLLAASGVTHIITDYTVNALATTTIQQDAVNAWISMSRVALSGVYATTLTPQTTSTDSWVTTGNQTVQYPADREPRRVSFNNWLRDGAPINASNVPQSVGASGAGIVRLGQSGHPLKGYFEAADLAETSRNSGVWKAGYTSDGTHPNATGHAALAVCITPSLFGQASL